MYYTNGQGGASSSTSNKETNDSFNSIKKLNGDHRTTSNFNTQNKNQSSHRSFVNYNNTSTSRGGKFNNYYTNRVNNNYTPNRSSNSSNDSSQSTNSTQNSEKSNYYDANIVEKNELSGHTENTNFNNDMPECSYSKFNISDRNTSNNISYNYNRNGGVSRIRDDGYQKAKYNTSNGGNWNANYVDSTLNTGTTNTRTHNGNYNRSRSFDTSNKNMNYNYNNNDSYGAHSKSKSEFNSNNPHSSTARNYSQNKFASNSTFSNPAKQENDTCYAYKTSDVGYAEHYNSESTFGNTSNFFDKPQRNYVGNGSYAGHNGAKNGEFVRSVNKPAYVSGRFAKFWKTSSEEAKEMPQITEGRCGKCKNFLSTSENAAYVTSKCTCGDIGSSTYPRIKLKKESQRMITLNEIEVSGEYGVVSFNLIDEDGTLNKLEEDMTREMDKDSMITDNDLFLKKKYIVWDNDKPLRVQIMRLTPLRVRYVDHKANSFECDPELLKICPSKFSYIYGFAHRGKINNYSKIKNELQRVMSDGIPILVEFISAIKDQSNIWFLNWLYVNEEPIPQEAREYLEESGVELDFFNFEMIPGEKQKVIVTAIVDDTYFYIANHAESQFMRYAIQEQNFNNLKQINDVKVGMNCLVVFNATWFRATVVNDDPLTVFYLDVGKTEIYNKPYLKVVPQHFLSIHPLAIKVKSIRGTVSENGINVLDTLSIKPIEQDPEDKSWIIQYVLKREVILLGRDNNGDQWVSSIKAEQFHSKIHKLSTHAVRSKIKIDQLYLLNKDGGKVRVVSLKPIVVLYIDFGDQVTGISARELYELPDEFKKYPPLAYTIKWKDDNALDIPRYTRIKIYQNLGGSPGWRIDQSKKDDYMKQLELKKNKLEDNSSKV